MGYRSEMHLACFLRDDTPEEVWQFLEAMADVEGWNSEDVLTCPLEGAPGMLYYRGRFGNHNAAYHATCSSPKIDRRNRCIQFSTHLKTYPETFVAFVKALSPHINGNVLTHLGHIRGEEDEVHMLFFSPARREVMVQRVQDPYHYEEYAD